jgi:ribonuclease P protein component
MREAHVPAQHPEAQEDARLPQPHAHARRPGRDQGSSPAGPRPPLGLIWRIRDRATFVALSRARARRQGPVTLRYIPGSDGAPARVAVATNRAAGNAVSRNRLRRRLRAAVRAHEAELVDGGAYLFAGGREAITAPFATLTAAVGELLREPEAAA